MSALSWIRLAHVLGMAVLIGGGAFTWYELRRDGAASSARLDRFECVFWGTLGVMFVADVGNVGAVGVPERGLGGARFSRRNSPWWERSRRFSGSSSCCVSADETSQTVPRSGGYTP